MFLQGRKMLVQRLPAMAWRFASALALSALTLQHGQLLLRGESVTPLLFRYEGPLRDRSTLWPWALPRRLTRRRRCLCQRGRGLRRTGAWWHFWPSFLPCWGLRGLWRRRRRFGLCRACTRWRLWAPFLLCQEARC